MQKCGSLKFFHRIKLVSVVLFVLCLERVRCWISYCKPAEISNTVKPVRFWSCSFFVQFSFYWLSYSLLVSYYLRNSFGQWPENLRRNFYEFNFQWTSSPSRCSLMSYLVCNNVQITRHRFFRNVATVSHVSTTMLCWTHVCSDRRLWIYGTALLWKEWQQLGNVSCF